jgi:hypothetical protein
MNFNVSLKGRVKNFQLQANKPMVPLWEAIVNSIHSIDEIKKINPNYNGKIIIKITRDLQFENDGLAPVQSIKIIDNGKGFDDDNFKSFMISDTEHKSEIGGKGVGRFSWLKAFDNADIESTFYSDKYYTREFKFDINTTNINENDYKLSSKTELMTSISLNNMKEDFKKQFPVKLSQIANEIISHCFDYFLIPDFHSIVLQDEVENINLNDLFNTKISKFDVTTLKILDKEFELISVKIDNSIVNKHKLILCANNRSVKDFNLEDYINDIESLKLDEKYCYLGLVNSNFLDNNVDSNRLDFSTISQKSTIMNGVELISLERIINDVSDYIKNLLKDALTPITEKKHQRVSTYINENSPQYRYLLKYKADELKKIKASISNEKLEETLYKIKTEFELEISNEKTELIKTITDKSSILDYEEKFKILVEKISDSNKSRLADYIIHRRAILELFEKGMSFNDDGKYSKEAFMHNLIYPIKKTSDDKITFDEQNLWLIDEKLSYYFYISSDIPFNNEQNEDRPDIMFFDRSIALSEVKNDGTSYDSIVIFELKRPMRDDLSYNSPIDQIIEYKTQIQTNTKKDKDGRYIKVDDNTKFYLYVICDVSPAFKNKIKSTYGLTETVDGLGYYRMTNNEYLEILSYDKILNDAKKRNQVLFEKLGI